MAQIIKGDDGEEYVEVDVKTIGETDFAVKFDDGGIWASNLDEDAAKFEDSGDLWIPKSAMENWPDLYKTGTALVVRWFAEKKGLV